MNAEDSTPKHNSFESKISSRVLEHFGRNVILYQNIEHILKDITKSINISAPISKFQAFYKTKTKKILSGTMGGVVTDYLRLFDNSHNVSLESDTEICVTIKTSISMDPTDVELWEKRLRTIISHRNWLVHQSIVSDPPSALQPKISLTEKLDKQFQFALSVYKELQDQHKMLMNLKKDFVEILVAVKIDVQFVLLKISALLNSKALKTSKDGSFSVGRLETLARQTLGDTLKDAMQALKVKRFDTFLRDQIEGIDLYEEETEHGTRIMARFSNKETFLKTEKGRARESNSRQLIYPYE